MKNIQIDREALCHRIMVFEQKKKTLVTLQAKWGEKCNLLKMSSHWTKRDDIERQTMNIVDDNTEVFTRDFPAQTLKALTDK